MAIGRPMTQRPAASAPRPPNCPPTEAADNLAVASAASVASKTHPTRSFSAAAEIATRPSRVSTRRYSRKMRPRIGTAVIANATAEKPLNSRRLTSGARKGAATQAKPKPSASGAAKLAAAIRTTALPLPASTNR